MQQKVVSYQYPNVGAQNTLSLGTGYYDATLGRYVARRLDSQTSALSMPPTLPQSFSQPPTATKLAQCSSGRQIQNVLTLNPPQGAPITLIDYYYGPRWTQGHWKGCGYGEAGLSPSDPSYWGGCASQRY